MDLSTRANVEAAARRIVALSPPGRLVTTRVRPNQNGFGSLYLDMGTIYNYAKKKAEHELATERTKKAFRHYGPICKGMLEVVGKLRYHATQVKMTEELTRTFPNDRNYAVYDRPDGGKYDPIDWKLKKVTYGGMDFVEFDQPKSVQENPSLAQGHPVRLAVDRRVAMFYNDHKDLVTRDVKFPDANSTHKDVVKKIKIVLESCT